MGIDKVEAWIHRAAHKGKMSTRIVHRPKWQNANIVLRTLVSSTFSIRDVSIWLVTSAQFSTSSFWVSWFGGRGTGICVGGSADTTKSWPCPFKTQRCRFCYPVKGRFIRHKFDFTTVAYNLLTSSIRNGLLRVNQPHNFPKTVAYKSKKVVRF